MHLRITYINKEVLAKDLKPDIYIYICVCVCVCVSNVRYLNAPKDVDCRVVTAMYYHVSYHRKRNCQGHS